MKRLKSIAAVIGFFSIPLMFSKYANYDTISAVLFVLIVTFLIIKHRKKLDFQMMLNMGKIPLIYAVLWRTKFGLKFMDKIGTKYRELVKFLGYCFIGVGFTGMIIISYQVLKILVQLIIKPVETSEGFALILPYTNIPGFGVLSFWHFLITIFITMLIHEFAHGIVARAHKVPVKASGLGVFSLILPIFPVAFVETDEKKMNKEKDIVQYSIFAAGPIINLIFAFLISIIVATVMTPIETSITHPVGISFDGTIANFSAEEAGMIPGMVINSVNGYEVLDYTDFRRRVDYVGPDTELELGTIDNGSFTIVTKPSPEDPKQGYIGIKGIREERRVNEFVSPVTSGVFSWFKGLFKWMFIINFVVALMNLLPMIVTDGGRMLKVAFEKIFEKKKAQKMWSFIGGVFLFTLLLGLVMNYVPKLFMFFVTILGLA
jgi:hypothetical protein